MEVEIVIMVVFERSGSGRGVEWGGGEGREWETGGVSVQRDEGAKSRRMASEEVGAGRGRRTGREGERRGKGRR